MSTQTISLTDSIYIRRSPTEIRLRKDKRPRELLVYFIPGNPGLIQYYNDFLTHLASLLDPDTTGSVYHVVGYSLSGFELEGNASGYSQLEAVLNGRSLAYSNEPFRPYDLKTEQEAVFANIERTVSLLRRQTLTQEPLNIEESEPLPVVLMGHSVGAYIMMQNLMSRQLEQTNGLPGGIDGTASIIGAIGLFPTVVDLAGSPRGRKLAPLGTARWFARLVQCFAYSLRLIPAFMVRHLVKYITGQLWKAVETTTAFLRSKHGVYQALYLARYELLEMTVDQWPKSIWNRNEALSLSTTKPVDRPQLYFFWGNNDPWIQNSTRDEIITKYAYRTDGSGNADDGGPYMQVDKSGLPHDFCIQPEHSKRVAEKVAEFLRDVTGRL